MLTREETGMQPQCDCRNCIWILIYTLCTVYFQSCLFHWSHLPTLPPPLPPLPCCLEIWYFFLALFILCAQSPLSLQAEVQCLFLFFFTTVTLWNACWTVGTHRIIWNSKSTSRVSLKKNKIKHTWKYIGWVSISLLLTINKRLLRHAVHYGEKHFPHWMAAHTSEAIQYMYVIFRWTFTVFFFHFYIAIQFILNR